MRDQNNNIFTVNNLIRNLIIRYDFLCAFDYYCMAHWTLLYCCYCLQSFIACLLCVYIDQIDAFTCTSLKDDSMLLNQIIDQANKTTFDVTSSCKIGHKLNFSSVCCHFFWGFFKMFFLHFKRGLSDLKTFQTKVVILLQPLRYSSFDAVATFKNSWNCWILQH